MSSDAAEPPVGPGTPLGQNYVLHEELGRGAMGRVHRATRRDTGAEVVAKLLWPHLAGDPEIVARFVRERLILTRIKNPHLVQVLDLVAESDTLAIISELVRGPNLRTYLQERGRLEPAVAADLTAQVLQGLATVHNNGVIHRDVKPANVLLDLSGAQPVARLTDFSIARLAEGPSLTKTGGSLGTPDYLAPEVAKGSQAGPAADVYSTGVLLYELLCGVGQFPAVPETGPEKDPQPKPDSPGLPKALWSLIVSMLAGDPEERPTARATAAALRALSPSLAGRQLQPPTGQPTAPHGEPQTRHRRVPPEGRQQPTWVRPALPSERSSVVPPRPVPPADDDQETRLGSGAQSSIGATGLRRQEDEKPPARGSGARRRVLAAVIAAGVLLVIAGFALVFSLGNHPTKVLGNKTVRQTPPGAPSAVGAAAINGGAVVTWTPPSSSGNSPLAGFLITSSPGGVTATAAPNATVTVISGLTSGVSYTFAVQALNAVGPSASVTSGPVTPTGQPGSVPPSPTSGPSVKGYWLVASDGGVFAFGNSPYAESQPSAPLYSPIVGLAATADASGYWLVAADGGVFAYGDAVLHGQAQGQSSHPIVGIVPTPTRMGYWLASSDGGVFAFGDAAFHGSVGSATLNGEVVAMAATPSGNGYWLVAKDGGVFAFGDALFYGNGGSATLNREVVGIAATPSGNGYWLVAKDGGVFAFGDAGFFGSGGSATLNRDVVGLAIPPPDRPTRTP
jgi:serine/threonine protein kinase